MPEDIKLKLQPIVFFLFFIAVVGTASALEIGPGVIIQPSGINTTYTTAQNFNASDLNVTSDGLYLNGSIISKIETPNIDLTSLSQGNQTYQATYALTSGLTNASGCFLTSQEGNHSLNIANSSCGGILSLAQSVNNNLTPKATDGLFIMSHLTQSGVEIVAIPGNLAADRSMTSDLDNQYFDLPP